MSARYGLLPTPTDFGHANIIRYCNRPFNSVYEMDNTLIRNWNERVSPKDTVYHLGDFAFKGRTENYVKALNGNIVLIKGNHDKSKDFKYFHEAVDSAVLKIGKFTCYLTHLPMTWESRGEKYPEEAGMVQEYSFILTGHVHEKWRVCGTNINVGVDVWGMTPVSEECLGGFLLAEAAE